MNKQFITAFITPDKWPILWYDLKPYSVLLHLQLEAIHSPFVTGQVPTEEDTVIFLKLCSCDCNGVLNIPKLTIFDKLLRIKLSLNKKFHAELLKAIMMYIREYSSVPKIILKKNNEKETVISEKDPIPELLVLSTLCMSKLNMSEKDVANMPINRLVWYSVGLTVTEGGELTILSEEDEERMKTDFDRLDEYLDEQADKLRYAMVNGRIKKRKINVLKGNKE